MPPGEARANVGVPDTRKKSAANWLPIPERVQVAIVFLPVLITLIYVHLFAVDVPLDDQWSVVPAIVHMESGSLEWSDIYQQHTDSMVPVPVAITLLVAKLTRYNTKVEAYVATACLFGAVAVLFVFFRRLQQTLPVPTLAFFPISAIFLSWHGHESILWGAGLNSNLGLMLLLLTIWGTIRATESPRFAWRFAWVAIAMAILASFSFGSGLFAWPIGFGILMFPAEGKRSGRLILIWMAAAAATIAVYFNGYMIHRVPWATGFSFVFANLADAARYTDIYTGMALGATETECLFINKFLSFLFLPAVWMTARDARLRKALLPFAAVLAYLLLTIPPLLSSRLGTTAAKLFEHSSRYTETGAFWPIFIYVCLLGLACRIDIWRGILASALILISFGLADGYSAGLSFARRDESQKSACRETLKDYRDFDDIALLCYHPDFKTGRRLAFWLEEYHLSVFGDR